MAFLVGSIHVLTQYSYPLPPLFDTIWSQTKVLVEEVDLGEAADPAVAAGAAVRALLPEGQTLRSLLDEATYVRVTEKAAAAGMPMLLLDRMKPWLVAMTLMVPELQAAGFDPAKGLDRHFYERAVADRRPVRGLETAAYQLERMNGLPLPVQVEMLGAYLDDAEAQVKSLEALVRGWRTGDVEALEDLLLKEFRETPDIYERLLVERNRNWVPQIGQCQSAEPCLVVVGGAHLLGPDSVVAMLSKAGFTVEQQ
ncbi:MAG: TraB/GumN family protein [Vicinamibacterales bacterium]